MDVVLDENIIKFIKGEFLDPLKEETLSFEELHRLNQNVQWQKPNYEKIGCRILDTYFSTPTVVACSEGCNKQIPCKGEISKALVDSLKNQLVQDMRSLKVRLTKLDEKSILDRTSIKKGLEKGDGRSIGPQCTQEISTDSRYETQEPGQEQVASKKALSTSLSDYGSNDFDHREPNDCSVLYLEHIFPSEASITNCKRITRSKSREKKVGPKLVSSRVLDEQFITETTPSMTNSGATASPLSNKIGKTSKNKTLNKSLASFSQPSRSRKEKSQASKTKNIESGGSQVQPNGDSTIHENIHDCTVLVENCMLPTSKNLQCRDKLSNKNPGTLCKPSSVTSQSSAAVAEDQICKQNLSKGACETSRFGRTIKKVKLTSYDATPAYITALQQRPASLMIRDGQSGKNLNKASYDLKECKDQQPHGVRVGKDNNTGNDSGSDQSYWPGKDTDVTRKQKRYTKKLNVPKCIKKVSTVNSKSNVESKQKKRTSSKVMHEIAPPKLKRGRPSLKKSNCVEGEVLRSFNPIGSNISTNKNDSIHHTAESNERENLEDHIIKYEVASKTKKKSSTVEKKHVGKAKKKTTRTKKSNLENIFPLAEIASQKKDKKSCEAKGTEPQDLHRDTEPCKVTAKKGTLTHLKQRQKRQEYLHKQLQQDEAFDDFFDDLDEPQIGNFRKGNYQINSRFLNSPAAGDSTAFASFDSSCGSFFQTPTTSSKGKKSKGKQQIGIPSKASCNTGAAFTPRSALMARFAGDETDGRGWMVNTPTTTSKDKNLGVNLGLAVTPGELLERSVANHIIYNNRLKRPPKRPSASSTTTLNQSMVGPAHSGGNSQSGGRNASSRSLPDGSLGQSPDTSTRAGRLPEVAMEYEYSPAGPKRLKRLKLPSILDDVANQEEDGSDRDDYFEDGDN